VFEKRGADGGSYVVVAACVLVREGERSHREERSLLFGVAKEIRTGEV
jgi:hypothetical protein